MRCFGMIVFLNLLFLNSISQTGISETWYSPDSLKFLVQTLAHDSMQGRLTGTKGCGDAAMFIAGEFERIGLAPFAEEGKYFLPFGRGGINVIGGLLGNTRKQEIVIFSAHYDHVGTANTAPSRWMKKGDDRFSDTIYNGANDDASGVAAVISLARYYAAKKDNERTVLFIAFSGEELGLLGSQSFSSQIEPDSIKAVINIEMIGRRRFSDAMLTGAEKSDLIHLLNNRLKKWDPNTYKKKFFSPEYSQGDLFRRSDNYPFAQQGIPAHTIMGTSDMDKYYHSVDDEAQTLDYDFMSKVVRAIGIACGGIVSGEETPSRLKSPR